MSPDADPRATPPLNPLLTEGGEYPFVTLERRKRELVPPGTQAINFSMGDPREETPEFIREALKRAVPAVSSYPAVAGQAALRAAFTGWFARRYGVRLDPETDVLPANGTKEAVFLMAFAVVGRHADPAVSGAPERRTVVIPSPAYPVYEPAARFAGAEPYRAPLRSEDAWRFVPERVPDEVWRRTALLWLNTPHNPTGAVLGRDALARVAALARRHGFWVAADEAYAEIYFGAAPPSMLTCGLENVVVLHTLSKRSAMTGYRSGFIAGDPRLIAALRKFRPNVGVATPDFVQSAAIAAWNDDAHAANQRARYAAKRELFLPYFARRGWRVEASEASFYLWLRVPGGDDVAFVERLLRIGVVALPGSYLGPAGAGFIRFALVPTLEECREAVARMEAAGAALGS
ncbi:MAG TPA: aminotransferase class I/II-fold pyridoxal phosphate-dependent enzyme [Terriglobales bacterium]|nr:aminotransferase class I/II-fold pyridoxal phosphate-dependent enzyme [Terriglobales bacterium]